MTEKECVICAGTEAEGELLVEAPCGQHWICSDDVSSFFSNATNNESLFPPKCCGQPLLLQDYEDLVDFDIAWAYQVKVQGEYSVLARYRIYCANPQCAVFLRPDRHINDPGSQVTYAICENEDCGRMTCCSCRILLEHGTLEHNCEESEEVVKFKQTASEKGYKECNVCGTTVELMEACNHITCECGHEFCYVCGKEWPGTHGCPHYGPAEYDEEGYNQDGYHRKTELNRNGLTRREAITLRRAEGGEVDDDEFDEDEDEDDNEDDNDNENDEDDEDAEGEGHFNWAFLETLEGLDDEQPVLDAENPARLAEPFRRHMADALTRQTSIWRNVVLDLQSTVLPQNVPQQEPGHRLGEHNEEVLNEGSHRHIREDLYQPRSNSDTGGVTHTQHDHVGHGERSSMVKGNEPSSAPAGSEHSDDVFPATGTVRDPFMTSKPNVDYNDEDKSTQPESTIPEMKLNHQPWAPRGGWPEDDDEEL